MLLKRAYMQNRFLYSSQFDQLSDPCIGKCEEEKNGIDLPIATGCQPQLSEISKRKSWKRKYT